MPVRIEIGDNSTDPRVISLQLYQDGRDNFDLHYYYTSAEASFGGQVIDAQWDDLYNAVQDYMTQTQTVAADVALRFVHCFEPGPAGKLYLRLQICKMLPSLQPVPPGAGAIYDLDTTGSLWYEIKDGMINPTPDHTLEGAAYFNNFYYKVEPQSQEMEALNSVQDKYVRNLVLPWGDEILKMYIQNNSPANASIHFAACSYETPPERANVLWPHGMVSFLSDSNGTPFLNNHSYISIFRNKGADFGTLCPPECNVYIKPIIALN